MKTPSFRDMEQLSAFLDGQLSQAEKTRLEARIQSDPALSGVLVDLRQARSILRSTPKRHLPRNFTLTPKIAGIRPPVPRLVPALSWASATAMLLFILTLGTNLLGQLSFGAAAPMMAAAPMTSEGYGIGGGPAATQPSELDNAQITPAPEASVMTAPEATPSSELRQEAPAAASTTKATPKLVNIWLYIWLGLAAALITAALLIRRESVQTFRRKVGSKHRQ
jgi:negative regulator of sigma E activity